MEISYELNHKFSFAAVRERGGEGVEFLNDVRELLLWLEEHDSQLHDWKIYPASDLAAAVTGIRNRAQLGQAV